ncbi:MAG: TolC family protein [Spirochaetes bacterium]|jgi:outer membrane protein TolC|nr:TolC family protein [Spirochaetota bacterium]
MNRQTNPIITFFTASIFISAFILLSVSSSAAEDLKNIGLKEAVAVALKNNRDYLIAMKEQKAAEEKINAAWGQLYPVLESEAAAIRQYAEQGIMSFSEGQYDIKIIQLKFGINPGMFYNSLQLSRNAYKIAVENVRKIKNETTYAVIKAYFGILLSEELIILRKDAIKFLKINMKDVESLYKTGSVPRFELLQAQVSLKSQEPYLLDAENKHRLAIENFNYHLGLDENIYTADRSILDADAFKGIDDMDGSIKRLSEAALKNRPEIVQIRMKKEIAKNAKNINSSHYLWPTFTLGGSYGLNKNLEKPTVNILQTQFMGDRSWQQNWQVRVAATYRWGSLLPIDPTRAREREEKENMDRAEHEISKIRRLVLISIKSSCYGLQTSFKTIQSQKENVAKSEEGIRIARESYRAGVIKNSELLGSQLALTEARTGYINAINGYYQSLAELQRDTGIDDEGEIFGGR